MIEIHLLFDMETGCKWGYGGVCHGC